MRLSATIISAGPTRFDGLRPRKPNSVTKFSSRSNMMTADLRTSDTNTLPEASRPMLATTWNLPGALPFWPNRLTSPDGVTMKAANFTGIVKRKLPSPSTLKPPGSISARTSSDSASFARSCAATIAPLGSTTRTFIEVRQ